jgi:pimeloyl-ACP methyl ester carboxylesterase
MPPVIISRRWGRSRGLAIVAASVGTGLLLATVLHAAGVSTLLRQLAVRAAAPYEARGTVVAALGGRHLYLDCRGAGSPTVILEAGMGEDAGSWGAVLDDAARITRTCAYDRANRARSDPRGRHTLVDAAADLRAALAAAGEEPPFVVVGHSLGDSYARVFAGRHRDDVAGIVLVEGFAPDRFRRLIASAPPELAARWQANLDANVRSVEASETLDWATSEQQLVAVVLGDLRVEVVVAHQPFAIDRHVPDDLRAPLEALWRAGLADYSSRTRVEVLDEVGHQVQYDRPAAIVDAIERLVTARRAGAWLPACRRSTVAGSEVGAC